eukprot:5635635-Prymnesium_polylepis.1
MEREHIDLFRNQHASGPRLQRHLGATEPTRAAAAAYSAATVHARFLAARRRGGRLHIDMSGCWPR